MRIPDLLQAAREDAEDDGENSAPWGSPRVASVIHRRSGCVLGTRESRPPAEATSSAAGA